MEQKSIPAVPLLFVACVVAIGLSIFALVREGGGGGPGTGESTAGVASLRKEIEELQARSELARLADDAIANGKRASHDSLNAAFANDKLSASLRSAANAEIMRVQMFYLSASNLLPQRIPVRVKDKVFNIDDRLNTEALIKVLAAKDQPWQYRSRAAMLLGSRVDPKAVNALATAIKSDPNLSVVYQATRNFKRLTGCPSTAVFGGKELEQWLDQNRQAVQERLTRLAEAQKAGTGTTSKSGGSSPEAPEAGKATGGTENGRSEGDGGTATGEAGTDATKGQGEGDGK